MEVERAERGGRAALGHDLAVIGEDDERRLEREDLGDRRWLAQARRGEHGSEAGLEQGDRNDAGAGVARASDER